MGGPVTGQATYREATAERRVESLPLAHLSVELGHLYFEDFAAGPAGLRRHFQQVAPWAAAARDIYAAGLAGRRPRVSTCFLVDDYFAPTRSPASVVPELVQAAADAGLEIDYLARESGCAEAGNVRLAHLVEERIVADPPPDTTGARPPAAESGWLSNGQRSPAANSAQAMDGPIGWIPPAENAANRHSVFVDVELWDERGPKRTWSCAFLAAVWQLLRLGMLRDGGAAVATPQPWADAWPETWAGLPAVVQLNPRAAPFSAYRSLSVLSGRFFATEHAVRTILNQVAPEPAVAEQVAGRAEAEGVPLPGVLVDRISYVVV